MTRLRVLLARLRGIGRSSRRERELRHEIDAHLNEAADDYVRQGFSAEDARRAARRDFGAVAVTEEAYRDQAGLLWLDHLRGDLTHAVRALRRAHGFTLVVLIVLAMGTGAVTSVFALLNSVVLRPLPFPHGDRLVTVSHDSAGLNLQNAGLSGGLLLYYAQQRQIFDAIGAYDERVLNLRAGEGGTERVHVAFAGVGFFSALGAAAAEGRLFTADDGRPGFLNTRSWVVPILLAHRFWVDRFGGDPTVVGRVLTLNENRRVVVGVLPEWFTFPRADTQIWMLSEIPGQSASIGRDFDLNAVALLKDGVTAADAQRELAKVLPGIVGVYRDATPEKFAELALTPRVTPLKAALISDVSHVLWTLFAGMALLLLIATANAASLFAGRVDGRHREIAIRQALGANRRRLAGLFLTEALLLTVAAATAGLLFARLFLWVVVRQTPIELPRISEIGLDGFDVMFAAGLAVLMAAFYALLSIRRQGDAVVNGLLRERSASGPRPNRWRRDPFVVLQVALALSLLVGSVLMLKTYRTLSQTTLGFSAESVLTMEVSMPSRKAGQHVQLYQQLVDRIRQLPGVERSAAASFAPLTPSEHLFPTHAGTAPIPFKFFTPGYFQAMKTAVVNGAGLAPGEPVLHPSPVIVSASLARRLFPDTNPIGQSIQRLEEDGQPVLMASGLVPAFTIAGIVEDVRETTLRDDVMEVVYIPLIDPPVELSIVPTNMTLIVRTRVPPLTLAPVARDAIVGFDPTLSVGRVRTMASIVRSARGREAFVGALLMGAAIVSVFLGAVGIYGSVAYVVRRRTREIGIRLALGARRTEIVRMVVAGSLAAIVIGSALGLLIAVAGTRLLRTLLFGVEPGDPAALAAATGSLVAAGCIAAFLAARQAVRIQPVRAMREE